MYKDNWIINGCDPQTWEYNKYTYLKKLVQIEQPNSISVMFEY